MTAPGVAVVTMTWIRNPAEEAVIRRSLCRLTSASMPVIVADRGTNEGFSRFLDGLPGVRVVAPAGSGLVGQIAAGFAAAADLEPRYVLYTEPDKESFFAEPLRAFLEQAPDEEDVGVVLAARTATAFQTFPPMQRYAEGVANTLCRHFCGRDGDYSYGPFLLARPLMNVVEMVHPALGWGWRPFVFRRAHETGRRVVHVDGAHECPLDQRAENADDRKHRLRQLQQNIDGLLDDRHR